jgi:anti-sigma-K factor RskA
MHALDLLDPLEGAAVREHLDGGCPRCAAELAAARQALDLLPLALRVEEPSPLAKARLMAAVAGEAKGGRGSDTRAGAVVAPPSPWGRVAAAALAAAAVATVVTGILVDRRHRAITAELRARIERQAGEVAALREEIRQAREAVRLVSSPGVVVVDLQGQEGRTGASARVFWDRGRDAWQLYAAGLAPAGPGKTYQLWLVTATRKISAGTFDTAGAAQAAGRVTVPPDAGAVLAAAVTDEPVGGSPQPTGSILLLGKI